VIFEYQKSNAEKITFGKKMIAKRDIANKILGKIGLRIWRSDLVPFGTEPVFDLARLIELEKDLVVFDVGANIGNLTNEFHQTFPNAVIHCFEPFEKTFEQLLRNTDGKLRIHKNRVACGSRVGQIKVPVRPENYSGLNSLVQKNHSLFDYQQMQDVDVITVDNYCTQKFINKIDILKTDTEGFDMEVLRGAEGMLNAGKVDFVLSECEFDRVTPEIHTDFFELHSFLQRKGFRLLVNYSEGTSLKGIQWASALFGRQT
jgi:FkbM family methyltransferase